MHPLCSSENRLDTLVRYGRFSARHREPNRANGERTPIYVMQYRMLLRNEDHAAAQGFLAELRDSFAVPRGVIWASTRTDLCGWSITKKDDLIALQKVLYRKRPKVREDLWRAWCACVDLLPSVRRTEDRELYDRYKNEPGERERYKRQGKEPPKLYLSANYVEQRTEAIVALHKALRANPPADLAKALNDPRNQEF